MTSKTSVFCLLFVAFQAFIFFAEIGRNNHVLASKARSRNRQFFEKESYEVTQRKGKPIQYSVMKNTTVRVGRTAVFRCVITGSPSRIHWKHNGRNVPHIRRYRTRSYSWGGVLRVKNVRVSDYGVYLCRARNAFGLMTSNEAYLNIRGVNPRHRERCEVYTGNLCSAHVTSRNVFIKFGQTQQTTAKNIENIFRSMSSYMLPKCKSYLLPSLCKYYFPPCDAKRKKPKAIPICKKDCIYLEQNACQSVYTTVKTISSSLRYQLPTCSNLPTADPENAPTNCQRIFSSKIIFKESETSSQTKGESPAEILKTLFRIVSGIPHNTEARSRDTVKSRDPVRIDVHRSRDDHQGYKGKCEPYVGKICSKYLNAGQMIFVLENRTQRGHELKLTSSLGSVIPFTSTKCRNFALKALCYYFFPPCMEDNVTPNMICRKDCEILEAQICSKEFQYAKTMPIGGQIIPECRNLPEKQDTCLELGVSYQTVIRNRNCYYQNPGKLVPQRPIQFRNTSEWCKTRYQMMPSNLLPTCVKEKLEAFGVNKSRVNLGEIIDQNGQVVKYCIPLDDKTPEALFNSSYLKTVTLPNIIHPDLKGLVSGIEMYVKNNTSYHTEAVLGKLSVYRPHKNLQLTDVKFSYRLSGGYNTFVGRGSYVLCDSKFDVEIWRMKAENVRIRGQSSDPVDVDKIELGFGIEEPSERMLNVMKSYGVFLLRIMKPKVEMYLSKTLSAKFSGVTFVDKFKTNAETEILVGKLYKKYLLAIGMVFNDIPLGKFVSSVSGIYLRYLDMFHSKNGNSKIGLSLSANQVDIRNIPFMDYTSEPLASTFSTIIPKGLYMAAWTGTPENCEEHDTFCSLIQIVVGKNREFMLTGETSWQWAHFKASIQNPAMSEQLPVEKVNIEVKARNKTDFLFGVQPYIVYKVHGDVLPTHEKRIVFTGTLYYSISGRQLEGKLKTNAVWKNAFGYPQLTIKRMSAGLSVRLVRPHFPNKLETRGDFEIGLNCNDNYENDCITGTAYIGMSDEINEQYFHGIMSRFTIQDIFRVHHVRAAIPAPIANIGFPDGLEITFAKQPHDLEAIGGPTIRPGFTMRGKIRVLGIESDCSVNLKPNEFIVDADINGEKGPIKLGGVTPLYRSRSDRKNGPKLYLETRFSPKAYVKAHIDGYTRIFGVFDEIRILMTRRHLTIRLVTSIFQSFKVRINVMANYSTDLSRTHLKAKVIFVTGLAKLTRVSSKHVMRILNTEKEKLQTIREEMKAIRTECQTESKAECDVCLRSPTCRAKLDLCRRKLTLKERLEYSRSSSTHFCERAVRNNCKLKADECKGLCKNITNTSHSCKTLGESQKRIEEIKKSSIWVRQVKAIFSGGLCQVHSITFETKLTPHYIGDIYMNAKLDITILGQRRQIDGVKLKFGHFARLAADVASNAVEWYRKTNT